eukprot:g20242.t1
MAEWCLSSVDGLGRAEAHKELATLEVARPDETKPKTDHPTLPWARLRSSIRANLEVAEQAAQPAFEQVTKGLEKVELSMTRAHERLQRAKQEMHEVEKNFGMQRIQAERQQLLLSSLQQRRKQAHAGAEACKALEEEVSLDQKIGKKQEQLSESTFHCEQLKERLQELERQIMRRYCQEVTPEEILALRRQVARQLERRSTLERTRKGARRWAEEARLAERLVIE